MPLSEGGANICPDMGADSIAVPSRAAPDTRAGGGYDKLLFGSVLLLAFFSPISIGGVELFGALAFALWLGALPRLRLPERLPAFVAPLLLFVLLTVISIFFSVNPIRSLWNGRSLLVFLLIPVITSVVNSSARVRAVVAALAGGGLFTAAWGTVEVLLGKAGGDSGRRLVAFLSHYMTAGGALMLVALTLLAAVLLAPRRWEKISAGLAVVVIAAALGLTQSRNAYVGLAAGCVAVLFVWRPGVVALLPFALSLAVLLSPPLVRERIFSMVDLQDESIRNRFDMAGCGLAMIADFPLFGTGLQQVEVLYPRYKSSPSMPDVPHLHNNLLQIAAERGLPAAAVWLWFIAALGIQAARMARLRDARPWARASALTAVGAVVGLFAAGMFEYNFGDTEVLILFVLVTAMPYGLNLAEWESGGSED